MGRLRSSQRVPIRRLFSGLIDNGSEGFGYQHRSSTSIGHNASNQPPTNSGPKLFLVEVLRETYGERFMCSRQCNEFISNLPVLVRGEGSPIEDLSVVPLNQACF